MTYNLCKKLMQQGRLSAKMLDVYFAAGRLTDEEYAELMQALHAENAPLEQKEAESGSAGEENAHADM